MKVPLSKGNIPASKHFEGKATNIAVGVLGFRQWAQLVQAPSSDITPTLMGNIRALNLNAIRCRRALSGPPVILCSSLDS